MPRLIPKPLPESVRDDPQRKSECDVYNAFDKHAPDDMLVFYSVAWLGKPHTDMAQVDGETDFEGQTLGLVLSFHTFGQQTGEL